MLFIVCLCWSIICVISVFKYKYPLPSFNTFERTLTVTKSPCLYNSVSLILVYCYYSSNAFAIKTCSIFLRGNECWNRNYANNILLVVTSNLSRYPFLVCIWNRIMEESSTLDYGRVIHSGLCYINKTHIYIIPPVFSYFYCSPGAGTQIVAKKDFCVNILMDE